MGMTLLNVLKTYKRNICSYAILNSYRYMYSQITGILKEILLLNCSVFFSLLNVCFLLNKVNLKIFFSNYVIYYYVFSPNYFSSCSKQLNNCLCH